MSKPISKPDSIIIVVFTTLALVGIVAAIIVQNNPPVCPSDQDARYSGGYWYCVPKGQLKWGPMRD
jgi:hypothetical protein